MRVLRLFLGVLIAWPALAAADPTDAERQQLTRQLVEATKAAEAAELADNLAEARKLRQKCLELHLRLQGEKHWQVGDARRALAHLDLLAKLSVAQRKELAEAARLNDLLLMLYAQHRSREAVPLAQKVLQLRRKLLGEEHVLTAQSYNNLAAHLNKLGKFAEADSFYRQALAVRTKLLGPDHPEVALTCHNQAFNLRSWGKRADADLLDRQALDIRRKVLGEDDADTARSYNTLGLALYEEGKYQESESLNRRALAIRQKALGEQHADTAQSCNNLALVLHALGKYEQSEPLYRKALVIWRKTSGEGSADAAVACSNLGLTLMALTKHAEAEAFYRQSLTIRRKVLGEQHADTARSYDGLGVCLDAQGKHGEADEFLRTGLAIREIILDPQHPDLAESYNNLGQHLGEGQGKYTEAESYYRKALAIWLKVRGEEHFYTAVGYYNLASCLDAQDKLAEAGPLHQKALAIVRRVRGEEHLDTAIIYTSVAKHLYLQGKYREAEPLMRKVLELRRKHLGEDHGDTVQAYNNLAANLIAQEKYVEAADLLIRAAAICRKKNGNEDQPVQAFNSFHQAVILSRQGSHVEAGALLRQALVAFIKAFGRDHPETAATYRHLAWNLYAQGNYSEAEKMAALAATAFQAARLHISSSGLDRASYSAGNSPLHILAALLARRGQVAAAQQYLEENLGRGLLDDLNGYQRLSGPERGRLRELASRIEHIDKQLADLAAAAAASGQVEAERLRRERDAWKTKLSAFQGELTNRHGVVAGQVYDLARIQSRLPAAAALIAWVDLVAPPKAADPNGDHWVCLVRRTGPPVWVKTRGSGANGAWTNDDDTLPDRVRQAFSKRRPDWRSLAIQLAAQRLAPVERYLQEGSGLPPVVHLVVLPSPGLAGVPVETLTDRYRISYAPSGTMFAWLQEQQEQEKQSKDAPSLLALGDPVFQPVAAPAVARFSAGDNLDQALRGPSFRPLPASRREVEAIAALFARSGGRVEKLLGADASEQRLDQLIQRHELEKFRYLHLATHGQADVQRGLSSYLALARPADPLSLPSAGRKYYDGKLTAAQILHSWKLNADLVTLGACETGLGQQQGGEGYLGFAQALFLAGSRSLVLSLWQVDDRATSLLMMRFYQNLLGKRPGLTAALSKAAALAEAKDWLRRLNRDEIDRQDQAVSRGSLEPARSPTAPLDATPHPFAHPHYWAAFILVGDPGTINRTVPATVIPAAASASDRTSWRWFRLAGAIVPLAILAVLVWRRRTRRGPVAARGPGA